MFSEEEIREWELLPLNVRVLTSQQMGAWLYYRDKRRDKRVKSDLLDKVAEKLKAKVMTCANCEIIGCDTEYFRPMCEKAEEGIFAKEFSEYVNEVIEEMKAEVENAQGNI